MQCRNVQKLMAAQLDGALSADKQAELEAHLKRCKSCAADFGASREIQQLLGGMARFPAPTGFSRRVMARLDPAPPARPFFAPLCFKFAEVALLLLVIGIGVLSGRLLSLPARPALTGSESAALSLDLFDPAPAGSLGGIYLAMLEDGHAQ